MRRKGHVVIATARAPRPIPAPCYLLQYSYRDLVHSSSGMAYVHSAVGSLSASIFSTNNLYISHFSQLNFSYHTYPVTLHNNERYNKNEHNF